MLKVKWWENGKKLHNCHDLTDKAVVCELDQHVGLQLDPMSETSTRLTWTARAVLPTPPSPSIATRQLSICARLKTVWALMVDLTFALPLIPIWVPVTGDMATFLPQMKLKYCHEK
jgi:hypothetical protein